MAIKQDFEKLKKILELLFKSASLSVDISQYSLNPNSKLLIDAIKEYPELELIGNELSIMTVEKRKTQILNYINLLNERNNEMIKKIELYRQKLAENKEIIDRKQTEFLNL